MIISEEIKQKIKNEYNSFKDIQYAGKTLEERRELDAFFTPPELTIKMIEKFESIENKTILDPTCGTGNLLAACIIAGVNPEMIYGNEFDPSFVKLCQERLGKLGVPSYHIHQGDALKKECLDIKNFNPDWKYQKIERVELW